MTTIDALYSRILAGEQETFARDAQRVADQAAHIAANPPTADRSVSGDITRLAQDVTDLLRRAAKIEGSFEAQGVFTGSQATTEK